MRSAAMLQVFLLSWLRPCKNRELTSGNALPAVEDVTGPIIRNRSQGSSRTHAARMYYCGVLYSRRASILRYEVGKSGRNRQEIGVRRVVETPRPRCGRILPSAFCLKLLGDKRSAPGTPHIGSAYKKGQEWTEGHGHGSSVSRMALVRCRHWR